MSIVLKINGTNRSNLINFDSLQVQGNLYSKAGACYFTYEKFGSRVYVPAGGDEIGDWDGATKIFGGKITGVTVKIVGKILVYDVECKDWIDQLDGLLVSETYENKTVNEIITDIQSKYATTFDITNVSCTTNIEAIVFDMKPVSKCLDDLAKIAGYHWYVDPDKKIYFFVEGSISAPFNITDTNGKCLTQSLEIEDDYEQIKNRVNLIGSKISNVQVHDAASIAAYGEHEIVIKDNNLSSTAEAEQRGNAVLAAYKDPVKKGSFETYDAGLVPGQKINVNSALRGVNQDFIIESVSFGMRTPTKFIYKVKIMTQQDKGLIELLEKEIMSPLPDIEATHFGDKNFDCDIKFSIVNYHKVSWLTGKIEMSSGETYTISAGDRTFTNTEICYFKPSTSETELQFSDDFADGVGDDRIPLAYAIPNPNVAKGAQFIPVGFMGGVRFWGGENIVARTIIAEQIALNTLTATELIKTENLITETIQVKDAIITNAKIVNLAAEKITSQIVDAQIANIEYAKIDNVSVKNVDIGEVLTVGNTEAKCTDPNADQTSTNPQSVGWLTDAGAMAYEDMVGLAKLDNTIIVGGFIKTSLLTADNIITGTLNASLVTVTNLVADNITAGTLNVDRIAMGSIVSAKIGNDLTDANINSINFENITAINISADSITAGTLTGRTIQTGETGEDRIVIYKTGDPSFPNSIKFFDSNDAERSEIVGLRGGSYSLSLHSGNGITFDVAMVPMLSLSQTTIIAWTDIEPDTTNVYDLGYSSKKFRHLYLSGNIVVEGNVDGVNVSSHAARHKMGGADNVIISNALSGNGSGISSGWAYTHKESSSAHHTRYSNTEARTAMQTSVAYVGGSSGAMRFNYAGRLQVDNHFDPSTAGTLNQGGAARYWNWINCNNIDKKTGGGAGWLYLDSGVKLQDGRNVSDVEAIQNMKPSEEEMSENGQRVVDPKTLPEIIFRRARDNKGKLYPRDENDKPYKLEDNKRIKLTDGEDVFATISLLLGAVRELDNKIKELE